MASRSARRLLVFALVGLSVASSGCAVEWTREHELYCRMDETLAIRETLTFDRAAIDEPTWQRFESDAIATAFPNGYTLIDARDSRVVTLVHPDDGASDAAAREIVKRFHAEFPQSRAFRERTTVCASR
jgi:hypothetical protein